MMDDYFSGSDSSHSRFAATGQSGRSSHQREIDSKRYQRGIDREGGEKVYYAERKKKSGWDDARGKGGEGWKRSGWLVE